MRVIFLGKKLKVKNGCGLLFFRPLKIPQGGIGDTEHYTCISLMLFRAAELYNSQRRIILNAFKIMRDGVLLVA